MISPSPSPSPSSPLTIGYKAHEDLNYSSLVLCRYPLNLADLPPSHRSALRNFHSCPIFTRFRRKYKRKKLPPPSKSKYKGCLRPGYIREGNKTKTKKNHSCGRNQSLLLQTIPRLFLDNHQALTKQSCPRSTRHPPRTR